MAIISRLRLAAPRHNIQSVLHSACTTVLCYTELLSALTTATTTYIERIVYSRLFKRRPHFRSLNFSIYREIIGAQNLKLAKIVPTFIVPLCQRGIWGNVNIVGGRRRFKPPKERDYAPQLVTYQHKKSRVGIIQLGLKRRLPTLPPKQAVPSALVSLTSLFGMGRGGTSLL